MHDHLTFRWPTHGHNTDLKNNDSREIVARTFVDGLTERGADAVTLTQNAHSWTVNVRLGKHRFAVLVGCVDEERDLWLVVVASKLSRLRRLFGTDDTPHLIGLLRWIEEIAFSSEHCVDHAWHTKDAWQESLERDAS